MISRLTLTAFFFLCQTLTLAAQVDRRGVDTTDTGYRVGYQIGSWLPFAVVVGLALLIIFRSFDFSSFRKKDDKQV